MEKLTLKEIVHSTGGRFVFGNPNQPVPGISTDSRTLKKGDVFVALRGRKFDGHAFIARAIESGAGAIVSEKMFAEVDSYFPDIPGIVVVKDTLDALGALAAYYRKKFSCKVVCVSGSNGKTTTKEMINSILSLWAPTLASCGNFNNLVGLPLTIFKLEREHRYCVLELGISIKGEMEKLAAIATPDVAVLTNAGRAHLEFLSSVAGVVEEKLKLFGGLNEGGCAVLNADDPLLLKGAGSLKTRSITFGIKTGADIMADNIVLKSEKASFNLLYGGKNARITVSAPGKFNVYNALAASSAAFCLGAGIDTVKEGLEKFMPLQMRMEVIEMPSGAVLINDAYNANPDSVRNALESFIGSYPEKKKTVVIGDMLELGAAAQEEHRLIGEFLKKFELENIFLYGRAMRAAADVFKDSPNVFYSTEQEEIIARLKPCLAKKECAVFIKGSRAEGLEKIVDRLVSY
jgi:UDP-N-acetylmuramoyl-tripeptide--D-alanyl-D-alanine ligase